MAITDILSTLADTPAESKKRKAPGDGTYYDERTGTWRWRCTHRLPDGSSRRMSGSATKADNTKRGALQSMKDALRRADDECRAPELVRRKECPTVAEFVVDTYRPYLGRWSANTQRSRGTAINHILPVLGALQLHDVNAKVLETFVSSKLSEGLAPGTVNLLIDTLRRILSLAAEHEHIAKAPKIRGVKVAHREERYLTPEQTAALLAAAREVSERKPRTRIRRNHASMVEIALGTGLRRGELLGLRRRDVDFRAGVIHVRQQWQGGEFTAPKMGKQRKVDIAPHLAVVIRAQLDSHKHELVWCDTQNRPHGAAEIGALLQESAELAGLEIDGWHWLRHTFASTLVSRGCPLTVVMSWLGHSSLKVTQRYLHLAPTDGAHWIRLLSLASAPVRPVLSRAANPLPTDLDDDLQALKIA